MPHAWPVWLEANDGALLVATVGRTADETEATDADGQPLPEGQPVAVSRVALVSGTEGWVEGIRVDPRVRGMAVATDLQVAELHWLAAHDVSVIRYATSARNEGSHRLGARHGFELLTRYVSWNWTDPANAAAAGRGPTGFDEETRQEANRRRREVLARLTASGSIAESAAADEWWARLGSDASFVAGGRLYERRSWAMQELTGELFLAHVAAGEVVVLDDGDWAVAVVTAEAQPAEDATIHLAVVAGTPAGVAEIAANVRRAAGQPIRFRLPVEAISDDVVRHLNDARFEAWPWELHILARDGDAPAPAVEPTHLILADSPHRVMRSPD